jgi:hypothetical protein
MKMRMAGLLPIIILTTVIVVLVITSVPKALKAQEPNIVISLSATQFNLDRLAPGQTSGQATFLIDASSVITVEIIATIGSLVTSIDGPNGEVLNVNTIGTFGGEFANLDGTLQPDSTLILPSSSPGFHYIYSFPSLGSGNYTIKFEADPSLAAEVAVITQVHTDSPVTTTLFTTEPLLVLGDTAVLTAAIFEGAVPVTQANVSVVLLPEGGTPVTLTPLDNGIDGDNAVGDGLYSTEFIPNSPGQYRAMAEISGHTAQGTPFFRQSATQFTVVASTGQLTGTLSDQGVDDNGNSLLDRIVISAEVNMAQGGDYNIFVHLKTAGGKSLVRSTSVNLPAGVQNTEINFEAAAFQELGENGPYSIELVELFSLGTKGAIPSDRLISAGQTLAYQLNQLEIPRIRLTGNTEDFGIDTNNNSLFDILKVNIEIDFLVGGFYQWSASLVDSKNTQIDLTGNSGSRSAGVGTIDLSFNGRKVGEHAVDGPYSVKDFVIFGAGASLTAASVATTKSYKFTEFEGAVAKVPGDLNGDGKVDCSDLAIVRASFGKRSGQPGFDSRADTNNDGVVNVRDLSFVAQKLSAGTRCP